MRCITVDAGEYPAALIPAVAPSLKGALSGFSSELLRAVVGAAGHWLKSNNPAHIRRKAQQEVRKVYAAQ
jgi:hypothetical protein